MISTHIQHGQILRELGDGLIIRRSIQADAEALSDFDARIHSDDGPDKPDERVRAWVRDLLKQHPTFRPDDFTIVEDTQTGKIVSSLNLISQTWTYEGIPFGVGRPELVGTLPEYRNRGLVRQQFDIVHQWSAERGELVQSITGIPYYYRLFGYEMTLNLGGGRAGFKQNVYKLKEGETESYRVRPATLDDLPFVARLVEQGNRRSMVACVRGEAEWREEIVGKSQNNVNREAIYVIESVADEGDQSRVGVLACSPFNWGPLLVARVFELIPGIPFAAVIPSVMRFLWATGESNAVEDGSAQGFSSFGFWMGTEHPVYEALHFSLPRVRTPYAWYIRVPDLPAFLKVITPALEQRIQASPYDGYSGELKITFYRGGLHLKVEKGKLALIEPYQPTPTGHTGDAAFPGLTFLQLLFGYRSLEELHANYPDVWTESDAAYGLLNSLFPKKFSNVWPIS